jgi:dTDP-glucose 4,6-dehydratase
VDLDAHAPPEVAKQRPTLTSRLDPLVGWITGHPRHFPLTTDCLAWPLGFAVGAVLKLVFSAPSVGTEVILLGSLTMFIQGVVGTRLGIYLHRWRFSSFEEVYALGITWSMAAGAALVINYIFRLQDTSSLPTSAVAMGAIAAGAAMAVSRAVWRRYWERKRRPQGDRCSKTIVFGAGEAGELLVKAMLADPLSEYLPVALLDDDPARRRREIQGVPVVGGRDDVTATAERFGATVVLVAVGRISPDLLAELAAQTAEQSLELLIMPDTTNLVGRLSVADMRPPTVDDLLGRDPVDIDVASVADYLTGKRVLVTGAGGSIGSELSRQVAQFAPAELYLLDRDESALHALQLSIEGRALLDSDELIVADIRDGERMVEVFERCRPQVVFHAAALKHLTLLENHPLEGAKTNVAGTNNVLEAAERVGVERFVNVSTDKAAAPTSVLGATKLAAERLTLRKAFGTGRPYLSVRFGNVLGSRGSVLPTFLSQIDSGGPLTVTDPAATRFFMTIPEAAKLVVQAGAIGEPGEVLILDMGEPVQIIDLARQLVNLLRPGTPIEFTGLRPGEKLHEVLVDDGEIGVAKVHPRIIHATAPAADPLDALFLLDPDTRARTAALLAPGVASIR